MVTIAHVQGATHTDAAWLAFLPVVLLASAWCVGSVRMAHRGGSAGGAHRARASLAGAAGWLVMLVAMAPPLERLGGQLLSAHMVQHELILVGGVPLLVLARPIAPLLWSLPGAVRHRVGALLRGAVARSLSASLTRPLAATAVHAVAIWGWHLPAAYDAAVASVWIHMLQHASFAVTAGLFWWAVLTRAPAGGARAAAPLLVLVTLLHTTLLGAGLAVAPVLVYASYAVTPLGHGFEPLVDQQLAGLVMWVPGGLVYVGAGLLLVARCLGDVPRTGARTGMMATTIAAAMLASGCGAGEARETGSGHDTDLEVVGAEVFAGRCARCHAIGGTGLPAAPDLRRSPVAGRADLVERAVRHGQGVMPAFGDELDDEEIEGVAAYVSGEIAGRIDLDDRGDLPTVPDI